MPEVFPEKFLQRMRVLLAQDFTAFENALRQPRTNALRVNTLKISVKDLRKLWPELNAASQNISWCDAGLYVLHTLAAGRHVLHAAGAYYMQEASAMAVAEILNPQPGMRVLDLCAAPGGKSTQLAGLMQNRGLLVCNEVVAGRSKILAENLERLGCAGVVTNEPTAKLARAWPEYFDAVLVDAPCSGEGMFRKSLAARQEWSEQNVFACAARQENILDDAAKLLKAHGRLVYSTCTFAPEENEMLIAKFLRGHPEFILENIHNQHSGFAPGRLDWAEEKNMNFVARLWPQLLRGEGHFVASLQKTQSTEEPHSPKSESPRWDNSLNKIWPDFVESFSLKDFLVDSFSTLFAQEIQLLHPETPSLRGLNVVRAGVPLAHLERSKQGRNRLESHHALSHFYSGVNSQPNTIINLELNDARLLAFLRGEVIEANPDLSDGWVLVQLCGLGLGWSKKSRGVLKNHYPKHLRL